MVNDMVSFTKSHPDLISLKTSQDQFGLPTVGTCEYYSPQENGNGNAESSSETVEAPCKNYFMTITSGGPTDSATPGDELPELFFSGEVHGDEQVGPHAVLETTRLLLLASKCIADIRSNPQSPSTCWPYDDYSLSLLGRLVSTRRTVVTPMSNALGFHQMQRT